MLRTSRPSFKSPLYIAWEVSLLCNAKCLHCYSSSGPGVRHPHELNTDEALSLIDQLAEAGLLILAFSGGEPLIRKDIFQLIERAVENQLVVNVASNGAIINSKFAKKIKESGVRSVTISLDAASAEVHDYFRQCPGLFKKSINAIKLLAQEDVRVVVSFTPSFLNFQEGRKVVELAYELGASAVNMSEYVPAGRGTKEMSLPASVLKGVINDWIEMRREYADKMQIIWHDCRVALLVPPHERDKYSGCGAGKLTARIMADGTLTPCVFLSTPAGNLKENKFSEIWENSTLLKAIRNRDLVGGNCLNCEHVKICGGCRAVSMAHYGSPLMGDPSCWIKNEKPITATQMVQSQFVS